MFALVTEVTYAPGQWTAGQAQLAEYRALRAQTPGFCGSLERDTGHERHLALTCWESAAHSPHSPAGTMPPDPARLALRAAGARLVAPLFAAPAQLPCRCG